MPLYKRPDSPNWWVSIGEDVRASTGIAHTANTPEETEENKQLATEFERTRTQQHWRVEKLGDRGAISFGEAAKEYLKQQAHEPDRCKREMRVLAWLMDTPKPDGPQLRHQSIKDVAGWDALTALRELGKVQGWAPATCNRMLQTVSAVIHCNPEWFNGERRRIPLYTIKKKTRPFIDADVIATVCQQLPWHLSLAAQFAVLTLLRMRAMLSLRWCDVYPNRRWAVIRAEFQKTNEPFGFALTDAHLRLLAELKKHQVQQWEEYSARTALTGRGVRQGGAKVRAKRQAREAAWDHEHVFTWWGRKIDDCNTRPFARVIAAAGCPVGFNWHSWRHTGATLARFAGLSLPDLQALGGWESIASVQRYAHIMPQTMLPAAQKLVSMLPSVSDIAEMRRRNAYGGQGAANGVAGGGYGGAGRDRTGDLYIANVPLSQLSYGPAQPTMPLLPNDSHPGPGCSCEQCLRRYPDDAGGVQNSHVGIATRSEMDLETFNKLNELVTAARTNTVALRTPGKPPTDTKKPQKISDLEKVTETPTGLERPRKAAQGR